MWIETHLFLYHVILFASVSSGSAVILFGPGRWLLLRFARVDAYIFNGYLLAFWITIVSASFWIAFFTLIDFEKISQHLAYWPLVVFDLVVKSLGLDLFTVFILGIVLGHLILVSVLSILLVIMKEPMQKPVFFASERRTAFEYKKMF